MWGKLRRGSAGFGLVRYGPVSGTKYGGGAVRIGSVRRGSVWCVAVKQNRVAKNYPIFTN